MPTHCCVPAYIPTDMKLLPTSFTQNTKESRKVKRFSQWGAFSPSFLDEYLQQKAWGSINIPNPSLFSTISQQDTLTYFPHHVFIPSNYFFFCFVFLVAPSMSKWLYYHLLTIGFVYVVNCESFATVSGCFCWSWCPCQHVTIKLQSLGLILITFVET